MGMHLTVLARVNQGGMQSFGMIIVTSCDLCSWTSLSIWSQPASGNVLQPGASGLTSRAGLGHGMVNTWAIKMKLPSMKRLVVTSPYTNFRFAEEMRHWKLSWPCISGFWKDWNPRFGDWILEGDPPNSSFWREFFPPSEKRSEAWDNSSRSCHMRSLWALFLGETAGRRFGMRLDSQDDDEDETLMTTMAAMTVKITMTMKITLPVT